MLHWSKFAKALGICSLASLPAGCADGADKFVDVSVIGKNAALFEKGTAILSPPSQLLRSATAEGLVSFGHEGDLRPALAERWIITDGGRSYIFRLRDSKWPDGKPITSESAATSLKTAIAALSGTSLGTDLSNIEEVRPMTGRVIELRLKAPTPDLLQLLAQPELGLRQAARGAGPMRVTRIKDVALLRALPPEKRGLPSQEDWRNANRPLLLRSESPGAAVSRFNLGYTDIVLGGRIEHLPYVNLSALSRGNIRLDPVDGLFGLLVLHDDGYLGDPSRREALAMAIDRESLLTPFNVGGWQFRSRIVNGQTTGDSQTPAERWADLSLEQRRTKARGRVSGWQSATGRAVNLRLQLPEGPGSRILFARLHADFATIGVTLQRSGPNEAADLRLIDQVARYDRAIWYLNQLTCHSSRPVCSPHGDAVLEEARRALTPEERLRLLGQAESEITAANGFIPLGTPLRWSLVRSGVQGFSPNRWGAHPLFPLAFHPK